MGNGIQPTPELDAAFHYAVIVGIDCYPAIRNLNAARRDAEGVQAWLLRSGVPKQNIRLIATTKSFTNADEALPTRQLIDIALRELMTDVKKRLGDDRLNWAKTRLYVYLSGHGVTPNANEAMLLMANAQPGVFGDSFPCSAYLEFYEDVQHFRELVFLADCCRSFVMQTRPLGPPFNYVPQIFGRVNKLLGFATGFGQLAFEPGPEEIADEQNARGFFTQALLEGLEGRAVDRPTGQINSTSLARYIRDRVAVLTATKKPGPQEPQMFADPSYPIVFVEHAPIPEYEVTIGFPAGFTSHVVLKDDNREYGRHEAADGPWKIALPEGLYELVQGDGTPFANDMVFKVRGGPRNVNF